jgi:hypothetical protein
MFPTIKPLLISNSFPTTLAGFCITDGHEDRTTASAYEASDVVHKGKFTKKY